MADSEESGERTEEATPQRREEFRNQGQVVMTRELGSAFILFGSALILWLMGKYFLEQVSLLYTQLLGGFLVDVAKSGDFTPSLKYAAIRSVFILGPVFVILGVLSALSTVMQIGFLTKTDAISPDINKMNPIAGFQKIFSVRSLVEGLKAVVKVSLVAVIAFIIMKSEFLTAPKLVGFSIDQLMHYFGALLTKLLFGIGLFMIILAVLDYSYQWWDLEKRMMMTKQEMKEEIKSREGNPQIKARIRRIQRDLAQKRMMEAVPKADVIITNPTHIAIALKYDANLPAPQVVAKGADFIAEKIREIARAHNIPIVENKPLARTIYKTIKIGNVIPRELFHAVAEVLAYVYRLKKRAAN